MSLEQSNRSFATFLLVLLAVISSRTILAQEDKEVQAVLQANDKFTENLYSILARKPGNVFFSPISIHAILSLAYQGAKGKTLEAFTKALNLPDGRVAATGYKDIMTRLNSVENVTLRIADKLFLQESFKLQQSFKIVAVNQFLSEVELLNFKEPAPAAASINSWVEKETNHKIKDLVNPADINDDTTLILVNAIYFKGKWAESFDVKNTKTEKFYLNDDDTVDVQMMHVTSKFYYKNDQDLDAQILELPYANRDISLIVVLPNKRDGIEELEKNLAKIDLGRITADIYKSELNVALPKFKIEQTIDLENPLTELGLGVMFSLDADLSGIIENPDPLYVSKVIQKAFIEVNEEGAEAAAATGTGLSARVPIPPASPKTVLIDHPFDIFLVQQVGPLVEVLFAGRVNHPEDPSHIRRQEMMVEQEEQIHSSIHNMNSSLSRDIFIALKEEAATNVLFSPVTLHSFLSVVSQDPSYDKSSFKSTLHGHGICSDAIYTKCYKKFFSVLKSDTTTNLSLANKLFVQNSKVLDTDFKSITSSFDYESQYVDFTKKGEAVELNSWVGYQTKNTIKDLISYDLDTRVASVNVMHLKAKWCQPFNLTDDYTTFHLGDNKRIRTQMMRVTGEFYCKLEDSDIEAVELPFVSEDVTLIVVRPKKTGNYHACLSWLFKHVEAPAMTKNEVEVVLPKFEIEQVVDYRSILISHSFIADGFEKNVLYGVMEDGEILNYDQLNKKGFIKVDADGVEAASGKQKRLLELVGNYNYVATCSDELEMTEMNIKTSISNRFAKTLITCKIQNNNKTSKEAPFSVVLPEAAFITEFVLIICGKSYKSYIKEKEEAKAIYNKALAKGKSAGIVEADMRDSTRFTVSVNLEPQSEATFLLTYEEMLQRIHDQYELVLNINPGQIVDKINVEVEIKESRPLKFVKTPALRSGNEAVSPKTQKYLTPSSDIKTISPDTSVVKFEIDGKQQRRLGCYLGLPKSKQGFSGQFIVQYDVERDPKDGEILLQDGYFVHFFAPNDLDPLPKHVVFALDTSGSMCGRKISQLKDAMMSILGDLRKNDLINIIEFNYNVIVWDINSKESKSITDINNFVEPFGPLSEFALPSPTSANSANIAKAKEVVEMIQANGGTFIIGGLETALYMIKVSSSSGSKHQPIIVLLTDGLPNVGMNSPQDIVQMVTQLNSKHDKVPIFSLSFGAGADKAFLRELSLKNFGFSRHVYEAADASLQLQSFYKEISSPLLSNITFKYEKDVTEVTRCHFPIYFRGCELVVSGRYNGHDLPCTIDGSGPKGCLSLRSVVRNPVTSLERLWAYLTVKQLLEERNRVEDDKESLTKRAVEIALKYCFVTEVTSLVVVKPDDEAYCDTGASNAPSDNNYGVGDNFQFLVYSLSSYCTCAIDDFIAQLRIGLTRSDCLQQHCAILKRKTMWEDTRRFMQCIQTSVMKKPSRKAGSDRTTDIVAAEKVGWKPFIWKSVNSIFSKVGQPRKFIGDLPFLVAITAIVADTYFKDLGLQENYKIILKLPPSSILQTQFYIGQSEAALTRHENQSESAFENSAEYDTILKSNKVGKFYIHDTYLYKIIMMAEQEEQMHTSIYNMNSSLSRDIFIALKEEAATNVLVSPVTVHTFLSVVCQDPNYDKSSLKSSLYGYGIYSDAIYTKSYKEFLSVLQSGTKLANKLFVQNSKVLDADFKSVTSSFDYDFQTVDFSKKEEAVELNSWVSKKTNETIRDLISYDLQTQLASVNVMHLKAKWRKPFSLIEGSTAFHSSDNESIPTQMMKVTGEFCCSFEEDSDVEAVELPFQSEDVSLIVVRPKNAGDYNTSLLWLFGHYIIASPDITKKEVEVVLPKFELEQVLDNRNILSNLSFKDEFDEKDLYGVLEGGEILKYDQVVKKEFITVDEEGAEAASGLSATMVPTTNLDEEATGSDGLKMYEMDIKASISNRFAKTTITCKIQNSNKIPKEAPFSVVLPEAAFITEFVMTIRGKSYKSYIKEKEEAKAIYNEALAEGKSAGIVEADVRDSTRFTVSVNLEPQSEATFLLTYEEMLQRVHDQYELVLNISPGQIVDKINVEVQIKESRTIKFVRTPALRSGNEAISPKTQKYLTPSSDIKTINAKTSLVKFEIDAKQQRRLGCYLGLPKSKQGFTGQFIVQYDVERDPKDGEILLQDGYFVHFFAPNDLDPLPKHVVFVLDTSGSMCGRKISQLKDAMMSILGDLRKNDLINIIEFNYNVIVWDINSKESKSISGTDINNFAEPFGPLSEFALPPPTSANRENIAKAKEVVEMIQANGSTFIIGGLETALYMIKVAQDKVSSSSGSKHQPIIVFLTDGLPNVGVNSPQGIVQMVTQLNSKHNKVPIFSLSFGAGANKAFLRELSLKNFGFSRHIYEAADASLQLQSFYKEISSPLLSEITFKYDKDVTEVTRTRFPIYFKGCELVVCGRYDGRHLPCSIHGSGPRGPLNLGTVVNKPVTSLERLWAYLTVKQLLEERSKVEENKESLTKRAVEIALKYSFVTEVTSLVVVKPDETCDTGATNMMQSCILPTSTMSGGARRMMMCMPMKCVMKKCKRGHIDTHQSLLVSEDVLFNEEDVSDDRDPPVAEAEQPKKLQFIGDRPFLVAVTAKRGDKRIILFLGWMCRPTKYS
ncbi:hypothetical protein NQ315_017089 [Exocentrus adspersus]|uniref:Uncharacterized protein n=1 Tax=Exocentrus adspersus TaxID=1586481 RepID=A0AAV8VH41_9CUCU|nr:hypothetical protein NQ315_017089 [Exocentrus adspersus]